MNKKCQVFTPADYVEELLDSVGYLDDLYGKKILENSCGDGNILVAVVQRYIDDCKNRGFSRTRIKNGLSKDIYGVEIDPMQYKKCIYNLNQVLTRNNIKPVQWKILNEDYLRKDDLVKYQYIVGNPPYITYKEMDEENQTYLKTKFTSCEKGKFDYCYAFIEKSINSLDIDGKMAYLIPSSIFKTVFGANLRACMKPYIEIVRDFTQEKMFDNALVKSAIMVLNANRGEAILQYTDVTLDKNLNLPVEVLGEKWFFAENVGLGDRRFGDYLKVAHVVATLLNDAYVLKEENYTESDDFIICNGHKIEKAVVRDTATPRSLRYGKKEKIIFPYYYENSQLRKYSVDEFENMFPGAVGYLEDFQDELDERESDDSAEWFEYGRSQALSGLNIEKLLISTVITTDVSVYRLSQDCIPYAGMYIVARDYNDEITLDEAMDILRNRNFMQYVLDVGIHISGSSLRITSKDIEDYRF
jgi:Type I restriction-modification system methyltransferase subunit